MIGNRTPTKRYAAITNYTMLKNTVLILAAVLKYYPSPLIGAGGRLIAIGIGIPSYLIILKGGEVNHEFDKYNERCKYNPCTHIHEPDCAVIEAVELGDIDFKRYESYLYLYDTIDEQIYW